MSFRSRFPSPTTCYHEPPLFPTARQHRAGLVTCQKKIIVPLWKNAGCTRVQLETSADRGWVTRAQRIVGRPVHAVERVDRASRTRDAEVGNLGTAERGERRR